MTTTDKPWSGELSPITDRVWENHTAVTNPSRECALTILATDLERELRYVRKLLGQAYKSPSTCKWSKRVQAYLKATEGEG